LQSNTGIICIIIKLYWISGPKGAGWHCVTQSSNKLQPQILYGPKGTAES
jgi:hypothetical protein